MVRRMVTALLPAITAAAVTLACGGDAHDDERAVGADTVVVTARDTLFEPTELRVRRGGSVTIELRNEDSVEHDLEIAGLDAEVTAGGASDDGHGNGADHDDEQTIAVHTEGDGTASVTFTPMDAGEYEFYCTITGHKEAGMVGTLIVE